MLPNSVQSDKRGQPFGSQHRSADNRVAFVQPVGAAGVSCDQHFHWPEPMGYFVHLGYFMFHHPYGLVLARKHHPMPFCFTQHWLVLLLQGLLVLYWQTTRWLDKKGPLLVSSMCLALWQDFLILSQLVDCECAHMVNSCQSNIIMITMSEFSLKRAWRKFIFPNLVFGLIKPTPFLVSRLLTLSWLLEGECAHIVYRGQATPK